MHTNETIQKASKFCATNGFMLQNNHQACFLNSFISNFALPWH